MANYTNTDNTARLDIFLMGLLSISRNQISKAISSGLVLINSSVCTKPSTMIKPNDTVEVSDDFFEPKQKPICKATPEIIFEDNDIIVINKPAGLVVHDGNGVRESTLVDYLQSTGRQLADNCGDNRNGIVHRLDVGTTGVMVVAKNNIAAIELKDSISNKETSKIYIAIIDRPLKSDILVDKAISRDVKNRVKMRATDEGKESKTLFLKLLESKSGSYELILAKLLSGRTHQIRAHLASIGRHIVGDSLYGFKSQNAKITLSDIFLHSYILDIKHPAKDGQIKFFAKPPIEFQAFLDKEFDKEKIDESMDEKYLYNRIGTFTSGL